MTRILIKFGLSFTVAMLILSWAYEIVTLGFDNVWKAMALLAFGMAVGVLVVSEL